MPFLIGDLRENNMQIKYFSDTDTALIELSVREISETKEISENLLIDIDADGNPVSITIEHAKETGALKSISYEEVTQKSI